MQDKLFRGWFDHTMVELYAATKEQAIAAFVEYFGVAAKRIRIGEVQS